MLGQSPVGVLLTQPHVQTGGLDLAGVQGIQQSGLVHVGAPGHIDDHHAVFHLRDRVRIHQGFVAAGGAEDDERSDRESSSSMETKCMVSHSQPSGLLRWTTERTSMPRAWAFSPTMRPMRP